MLKAKLRDETNNKDLELVIGADLQDLKENAKLRAGWYCAMCLKGRLIDTNIGGAVFRAVPRQKGSYATTIKTVTVDGEKEVKGSIKYSFTLLD